MRKSKSSIIIVFLTAILPILYVNCATTEHVATSTNSIMINKFEGSPSSISSGQSAVLQWDIQGAIKVNIDNGIGEVTPSGYISVTPAVTTTYKLTATNNLDSLHKFLTVTVDRQETGPTTQKTLYSQTPEIPANSVWIPLEIRYDNLLVGTEDYYYNQLCVRHSRPGPRIIQPGKSDLKGYITNSAEFNDEIDDLERLNTDGWGLATTFSPEQLPYKIQNIRLCAVAVDTIESGAYNKYHVMIKIIDKKGEVIWKTVKDWDYFKFEGTSTTTIISTMWRDIPVDNIIVNDDFTVEVIAESTKYLLSCSRWGGNAGYHHYFALGYEKLPGNQKTNSFISNNGIRANDIVLYNQYGDPLSFNWSIRVQGSYVKK